MAGPTKKPKRAVEPKESEQQKIIVDFEGRNPEAQDFGGIKQLLSQLFLKAHVDLSQMTDLIIAQHGMGCVLKQELNDDDSDEDEDIDNTVYGITTVINLTTQQETPCVQQFFSLLEELSNHNADPDNLAKLKQIINGNENIGFLINERFTNLPPVVSVSMFNSLAMDIVKMRKSDPKYNFAYYIIIAKTFKPKDNDNEEIFSNEEEEYFCKEATMDFQFSVGDESDSDLELVPYRRVIVFEANKLSSILNKIAEVVQP